MQKPLNFPDWVYGIDRNTPDLMRHVTRRLSESLGAQIGDVVLGRSAAAVAPGAHAMRPYDMPALRK